MYSLVIVCTHAYVTSLRYAASATFYKSEQRIGMHKATITKLLVSRHLPAPSNTHTGQKVDYPTLQNVMKCVG